MKKHEIEKTTPTDCRVPESPQQQPKFRTIICDPPWRPRTFGKNGGRRKRVTQRI